MFTFTWKIYAAAALGIFVSYNAVLYTIHSRLMDAAISAESDRWKQAIDNNNTKIATLESNLSKMVTEHDESNRKKDADYAAYVGKLTDELVDVKKKLGQRKGCATCTIPAERLGLPPSFNGDGKPATPVVKKVKTLPPLPSINKPR